MSLWSCSLFFDHVWNFINPSKLIKVAIMYHKFRFTQLKVNINKYKTLCMHSNKNAKQSLSICCKRLETALNCLHVSRVQKHFFPIR